MKRWLLVVAFLSALWLLLPAARAAAHAQPERANPPLNGTAASAPAQLEIWFTEEVSADDLRITVKGPEGSDAHAGDATLDLMDPERKRVTVPLEPGLGPGSYVVSWHAVSATDGDAADGFFSFFIQAGGTASPVASPGAAASTIAASASATATLAVLVAPTQPAESPANDEGDFDSRAFGLAVLVGIVVAIGIYLFWRLIRPKPGT